MNKLKQERRFECNCGKNYLSYPALFTHIKNKHNGIKPAHLLPTPCPPNNTY